MGFSALFAERWLAASPTAGASISSLWLCRKGSFVGQAGMGPAPRWVPGAQVVLSWPSKSSVWHIPAADRIIWELVSMPG